jgi:hypothetical protein
METPMEERVDPGSYRKRIYEFLESEGFKVTEPRHKMLSFLIKANANSLNEEFSKRLIRLQNQLTEREKALGARSVKTSNPIFCKSKEEHEKKRCYFKECKI